MITTDKRDLLFAMTDLIVAYPVILYQRGLY
jgi:hypothetical protein